MDGTSPDKNTPLLTLNQSHVIATVETLSQVSNMNTEPVIKQFVYHRESCLYHKKCQFMVPTFEK